MPKKNKQDIRQYSIAIIENKQIFEHELNYVLFTRRPIPKNHLIFHIDEDTTNNNPLNLYPARETPNDYHVDKNKIFHEDHIEENIPFIKKHFPEVYSTLNLENYTPDMFDIKENEINNQTPSKEEVYEYLSKERN